MCAALCPVDLVFDLLQYYSICTSLHLAVNLVFIRTGPLNSSFKFSDTSYCNLFQFLSFHLLSSEQLLISIEGKQTFINILIDAFFL